MASSGWQSEQTLYTYSSNVRFIGNINVSSIVHSGTKLTINGTIAVGARGTSGYYASYNYGVQAIPTGGNAVKVVGNNQQLKVGSSDYHVSFSATVTTTAAATSYSFPVRFKACSNDSCSSSYWDVTKNWTLSFDKSYDIPSDFTVANLIPEWNAVTGTYTVGNWGGDPWQYFATRVLNQDPELIGHPRTENQFLNTSATTQSTTVTTRITNDSIKLEGGVVIKGCGKYWSDIYAMNTAGETNSSNVMFYTAPAPVSVTYTDQTNTGSRTYPVKVTGDLVNNHTTYDTASLTRYIRYQVDGGAWQVVENNSVKTLDEITSFNITVPAGKTAVIESYMTYHGVQSEVNVTTITNGAKPTNLYGSVNGRAKALRPVYGAYGNYFSQQGPKLSTVNSNMAVSAESIRVTNAKSTASGYIWNGFAIPGTDELIGKKVTMNVEFKTSGNFTSGARLWWLNTSGVLLSGPVAGIEIINNSGSYSVSGTIPARPSGAGDLAVLLYSNVSSQGKGVYTDFTKVELKPDVSNNARIKTGSYSYSSAGATWNIANDYITFNRTVDTYQGGAVNLHTGTTGRWASDPKADYHLTGDGELYTLSLQNFTGDYTSAQTNAMNSLYVLNYDSAGAYSSSASICDMRPTDNIIGRTVLLPSGTHVGSVVNYTQYGVETNCKYNVKLEKGFVVPSGENLVDLSKLSATKNGLTVKAGRDGWITIKGTSTASTHFNTPLSLSSSMLGKNITQAIEIEKGGTWTAAWDIGLKKSGGNVTSLCTALNSGTDLSMPFSNRARTYRVTEAMISNVNQVDLWVPSGCTIDAAIRFHVKEGTCFTPYTPPVETKAHRLRKIYASVNGATKLIYTE